MGRKPHKNSNLPPLMRRRVQKSGRAFYYYDTGEKPRREIPLGDDYIAALRKYTELHKIDAPKQEATFGDVMKRYKAEVIPTKERNTIHVQMSDIKHLERYFSTAPLAGVKPMHIHLFLDKMKDKPTTANRCKRLFSVMWNQARAWGYTDAANPCTGIKGHKLGKREVYISDEVFRAVWDSASEPLRDAMDIAYLTGQRPADALKMSEHDIKDGHLEVKQGKTKAKLRIAIAGQLSTTLERIRTRKNGLKVHATALLVNEAGRPMTGPALRYQFDHARDRATEKHPELADSIKAFRFYDLRAKAADDTADHRGEAAASALLGHESARTTQRHYLRKGKKVDPTK
ncbi:MAG: tyrosine-type recombinase/integrase [Bacillota bacterium]